MRFGEASVAAVGRVNAGRCVFVLIKRFGEHVVTVAAESRGLEIYENRLIQSHPSDVGVGSRSGGSLASLCALRAGKVGPTAFEVSEGAEPVRNALPLVGLAGGGDDRVDHELVRNGAGVLVRRRRWRWNYLWLWLLYRHWGPTRPCLQGACLARRVFWIHLSA